MKKILVALSFAFAASAANANIVSGGLTLTGDGVANMTFSDAGWGAVGGNPTLPYWLPEGYYVNGDGKTGTLVANNDGVFSATYLGQVASFANMYFGTSASLGLLNENIGATTTMNVTAGSAINFFFQDGGNGSTFANGTLNGLIQGIAYFANTAGLIDPTTGAAFDFLIGYNDTSDVNSDFDDFVVGVSAVPVPAALPLMASALGVFGLARRKSKAAV